MLRDQEVSICGAWVGYYGNSEAGPQLIIMRIEQQAKAAYLTKRN
jgi:hypothetical protein